MNKLTGEQKAYLAGILDGEGYVGVLKENDKSALVHKHFYRLRIGITNTNTEVLYWIKNITGIGNIHERKGSKVPKHWKRSYVWYTSSANARDFLRELQPYLIIKREQAALGLALQVDEGHKTGRNPKTEESVNAQNRIYEMIKAQNRRGVPVETGVN